MKKGRGRERRSSSRLVLSFLPLIHFSLLSFSLFFFSTEFGVPLSATLAVKSAKFPVTYSAQITSVSAEKAKQLQPVFVAAGTAADAKSPIAFSLDKSFWTAADTRTALKRSSGPSFVFALVLLVYCV